MLVKKINWITLLLLLCQHACFISASAKTTVTCEAGSADLSCGDWGYITVIDAYYGRTDGTTCSTDRPPNQISNVQCSQETTYSIMSARCDGRKSCSVPATNAVFSDPCAGTFKYLAVSYYCSPLTRTITCQVNECDIDCEDGIIVVQWASYGRQDRVCLDNSAATTDCYYLQTTGLRSKCNGKASCRINGSHFFTGRRRHNAKKYIEVTFSCV